MRYLNLKFSLLVVILILLPSTLIPLMGQAETIITISLPEWQQDIFSDELFDEFEAAHPGVKVVRVFDQGGGFYISPQADEEEINAAFDQVLEATTKADIMFTQSYGLSIEMTRAGFFLDLAPLINNDPSFDTSDFFPVAWESYQWDNGIWAIPTSVNATLLVYDANAFDEAGLEYPNENWTLANLANAAEELSEVDEDGNVTLPGLTGWNIRSLIPSLLGEGLLDQNVIPNEPALNTPALQALIDEWATFRDSGFVQPYGEFDTNEVAMSIETPYRLIDAFMPQGAEDTHNWQGSLLPGGKAGIDVTAFAISAGTANPELSYELVKYLSESPEVLGGSFGEYPARQSMVGVTPDTTDTGRFYPELDEEAQALLENAVLNGTPLADIQLYNYISMYFETFDVGSDAETPEIPPLDEIQQNAVNVLAAAEARRNSQVVVVSTPVPTPIIQEGEIVLNFQLGMPFSPIPNRDAWDEFLAEFSANDPTVGNVNLLTGFGGPMQDDEVDCYYNFDNQVPNIDLTTVIALDPFMDADPNFDESDFLGNTITEVQRENATYGYPMTLQPSLISYNSELFEEAGIDAPSEDWTIDEFVNTVQALMDSELDPEYAYDSSDFGATYLYMLIAAYGGVPVDYSTTPVTYNLTDPDTINAIRQVLDLAKSGGMNYRQLDNNMSGGSFSGLTPMQGTNMTSMAWDLGNRASGENSEFVNPMRYVQYPRGSQYTPMSYSVGVSSISSTAADPEACYRLISAIASRPELLLGVPARRSLVQDPQISTLFGDEVAAFFRMFADQLDAPDAVIIPNTQFSRGSFTSFFEQIWINQAFDNYVLDDGDLEADLALAETNIAAYRTCVGDDGTGVDINSMEQAELEEFFSKFTDCASEVDPELSSRFAAPATEE